MVQAYARVRDLHPSRHVELVAAEEDDADWDAGAESLDGYAAAAVTHDAGGVLQDRSVRQERLDAGVGRGVERTRVTPPRRREPPMDAPPWLDSETRPIVLVTASTAYQRDDKLIATALEALADER